MKNTLPLALTGKLKAVLLTCRKHILTAITVLLFSGTAMADYTVLAGATVEASSITAQSGVLTIYGTLNLSINSDVFLANFTSVIIKAPNGKINWGVNKDLKFSAGTTFTVESGAPGLQPTGGNAAKSLTIGSITIAVSNDNSNNAAFSFDEFNLAGGLPQFTFSLSASALCLGSAVTATLTPTTTAVDYDCTISISPTTSTPSTRTITGFFNAVSANLTPTAAGSYTISCQVRQAGDPNQITTKTRTLVVTNSGTWLGANTDWNSTANWCNGTPPTASTNVVIPTGLSFYPVITGTALANNVTVATGGSASITVNGGSLKVAGTISCTAGINASAGTIELTGSSAQTLSATNLTGGTIQNLKLTNTSTSILAAGGMLKLSGLLSFGSNNNSTFNTNDQLTLLSSATATASVGDITNGGANAGNSITGKITVERFVPSQRKWRLLSAPVAKVVDINLLMKNSWQEGATPVANIAAPVLANNPNPGYGTHISYQNNNVAGFDKNVNGNSSIFYMTTTGFNGVPATTNSGPSGYITDQPGYMVFVRGDRGTNLSLGTAAPASNTILRAKGTINQGNQTITLGTDYISGAAHFRMINNPFPSAINFNKVFTRNSAAGFANSFYLWDPNIGGTYGRGGWVGMTSFSAGTYTRTVNAGSSISNNGDIQSGTAFLIDYNGASSTITIGEADKVTGSNNTQFRPSSSLSSLRSTLLLKQEGGQGVILDGALHVFDKNAVNDVDNKDLKKLDNFDENIAILVNEKRIAIENRQLPAATDTIAYHLSKLKQKTYQLEADMTEMNTAKNSVYVLEDAFTKTKTALQPQAKNVYDFTVDANSASADSKRLRIVIGRKFMYSAFDAVKTNGRVQLKWDVTADDFVPGYEVEQSADSVSFAGILNRYSDKKAGANSYELLYDAKSTQDRYYRIKAVTLDGEVVYSEAKKITGTAAGESIAVFSNPVSGTSIQLYLYKMPAGKYDIKIINNLGAVTNASQIQHTGGTALKTITLKQQLAAGQYHLELTGANKMRKLVELIAVSK